MPVRERRRLSGYDDSGADVSRTVLTQFYNATGGTGWTDDTNWLSGTPCGNCTTTSCPSSSGAWVGISRCVGTATGNVPYKINLRNGGLIGTLPTELALLLSLTQLQLGSNQISGTLPTELGALTGLTVLNVKSNALSGTVPSQLGRLSQLQSFKLSANSLSGTLPTHLALLAPSASCEFANSVGQISNSFACPLPTLSSGCFVALSCNESQRSSSNSPPLLPLPISPPPSPPPSSARADGVPSRSDTSTVVLATAVGTILIIALLRLVKKRIKKHARRHHGHMRGKVAGKGHLLQPARCKWQLGGANKYAAFLTHYKLEAGSDARFLHELLVSVTGAPVFLDSRDLSDLR